MHDGGQHITRGSAAGISLLVALPLIALKLVYLADVTGWLIDLAYVLYGVACMGGLVMFFAAVIIETALRRRLSGESRQVPVFAFIYLIALASFMFMSDLARPVVLRNPSWCRVGQEIDWQMSNEEFFVLVLHGPGNIDEHRFDSAWLNWSGRGFAGLPDIDFDAMAFGWWDGQANQTAAATRVLLRDHLAPSGLPPDELDRLADSIWSVLEQVQRGEAVTARDGVVTPIYVSTSDEQEYVLGGIVWMFGVLVSCQMMGQLTLVDRRAKSDENNEHPAGDG